VRLGIVVGTRVGDRKRLLVEDGGSTAREALDRRIA